MKIEELIHGGQSECRAWFSCKDGIHTDVFEAVCAMANTAGGDILLGVNENGSICGLPQRSVGEFVKGLTKAFEKPENFEPVLHLLPQAVIADGKYVILIHIPESAEVHAMRGKVYVRKQNKTLPVFQTNQLAELYIKKNHQYSERKILPYLKLTDLRIDLLEKLQDRIKIWNPEHLWAALSKTELLEAMNLSGTDYESGVTGFRFAAVVLIGKDSTIQNAFGQTAICIEDVRSGAASRKWMETNLLETREELVELLTPQLGAEEAIAYSNKLLLSREYTDMSPMTIRIFESGVSNSNEEKEVGKGNPILERIFAVCHLDKQEALQESADASETANTVISMEKSVKEPAAEVPIQQELPFMKNELDVHAEAFTPEERRDAILQMMRENEHIGISVMVRHLKVTKRTILRDIDRMKKMGIIKREGSEKSGKWIIM